MKNLNQVLRALGLAAVFLIGASDTEAKSSRLLTKRHGYAVLSYNERDIAVVQVVELASGESIMTYEDPFFRVKSLIAKESLGEGRNSEDFVGIRGECLSRGEKKICAKVIDLQRMDVRPLGESK